MSRYDIGDSKTGFVIGWDNPLQTFFVMSAERDPEEDYPVFSIGQRPMDIGHPKALREMLDYFGLEVPDEIMVRLTNDFDGRTPPTEQQINGIHMVSQWLNGKDK